MNLGNNESISFPRDKGPENESALFIPHITISEMRRDVDDLRGQELEGLRQTSHFTDTNEDPKMLFSSGKLDNDCLMLWRLAQVPENRWTDKHMSIYREVYKKPFEQVNNTHDEVLAVTLCLFLAYVNNIIGVLDGKRYMRELKKGKSQ